MAEKNYILTGASPVAGGTALVLVHGRGANAEDILQVSAHLPVAGFTLVAPQAVNNTWYPYSFLAPEQQNQPSLDQSLQALATVRSDLNSQGITDENIYWLGFSQGACLTLEFVTRNAAKYGGVVAFTGGLIGTIPDKTRYQGSFDGTPVLIASSDPDPHVPVARVQESSAIIKGMGADVLTRIFPGMGHTITQEEISLATTHVFNKKKS